MFVFVFVFVFVFQMGNKKALLIGNTLVDGCKVSFSIGGRLLSRRGVVEWNTEGTWRVGSNGMPQVPTMKSV